jgi:ferric-dicitrate binding protein FerR (iron transport regulator)
MIEQQNNTPKVLKVRLSDGSVVSLDPDSKISYRTHFEEHKREVHLEGEAFLR